MSLRCLQASSSFWWLFSHNSYCYSHVLTVSLITCLWDLLYSFNSLLMVCVGLGFLLLLICWFLFVLFCFVFNLLGACQTLNSVNWGFSSILEGLDHGLFKNVFCHFSPLLKTPSTHTLDWHYPTGRGVLFSLSPPLCSLVCHVEMCHQQGSTFTDPIFWHVKKLLNPCASPIFTSNIVVFISRISFFF